MDTEDWKIYVAFIRLEFPPHQRDIAQRLAVVFAGVVGRKISNLRPESRLDEVLGWGGAESLDAVEFVMTLEEECGSEIEDTFAQSWIRMTSRDLVEHVSVKSV